MYVIRQFGSTYEITLIRIWSFTKTVKSQFMPFIPCNRLSITPTLFNFA